MFINWLRNLKKGLFNLYYYFSVIWEDRQWDHAYVEELLIVKYKRLYDCLISAEYLTPHNEEDYIKALRLCIIILERRKNSFYTEIWDSEDIELLYKTYSIENRDWNWYCDMVKKYHNHWWN